VRSGRVIPAVQNVAHLRDHAEPTLVDLPVRILLASMGRAGGADPVAVAKDLERLCGAGAPAAAAEGSTSASPAESLQARGSGFDPPMTVTYEDVAAAHDGSRRTRGERR